MIFRRKSRRSFGSTSPKPRRRAQTSSLTKTSAGTPPRLRRRASFFDRRKNTGKTLGPTHDLAPNKKRKPVQGFWKKLKKFTLIALIATGASFIVYNLFISDKLNLTTITVFEDQQPLPDHPLNQILGTFKGTNLLLLNTEKIETFLAKKYPHYASIELHKNLPDTLSASLQTYPLVAHLYVKNLDSKTSFVLNTAGMAQNTEETLENTALPIILIERQSPVLQGERIIPQDRLAFILEAIQNFEDKLGMKIEHATYLDLPREAHLYTERKFEVWLDMSLSLDSQLDKLKKALPRLNIYEENLDYIDLRITGINGEKIVFKKK